MFLLYKYYYEVFGDTVGIHKVYKLKYLIQKVQYRYIHIHSCVIVQNINLYKCLITFVMYTIYILI